MEEHEKEEERKRRANLLEKRKKEIRSLEQEIDLMQKECQKLEEEGEKAYQQVNQGIYQHTIYQEALQADINALEAEIEVRRELQTRQAIVLDRKWLLQEKELEMETMARNRKNCALAREAMQEDVEIREQGLMQVKQLFVQRLLQRKETFRQESPLTPSSEEAINEARKRYKKSKKKELIRLLLSLLVHIILLLVKKMLQVLMRVLLVSIFCYISFEDPKLPVVALWHFLLAQIDSSSPTPV
ncbi:differentially expressed in FDCP 6 homolog isoform X2 [Rhinatrema bivittatum]|uniref:differentially expressed in FDCP 6 homolog isoform X2 n=1 Tax=Rhinatrema bivittatum TaxID=194408 RepID=UPI001128E996|nr:differentially expressed in FDCP 6 homolog isoform X2 [Rhinatrema bivittatum]